MQNVAAEALEELSEEERRNISPLDTILLAMHTALKAGSLPEAAQFAAMASPYCHPRLAATDVTVQGDSVHRVVSDRPLTVTEWEQMFAQTSAEKDAALAVDPIEPGESVPGDGA